MLNDERSHKKSKENTQIYQVFDMNSDSESNSDRRNIFRKEDFITVLMIKLSES
jgi:hypothetical protein